MGAIGLTGGAFYSHFPSKQALFEALISEEMDNSADMLAGNEDSPADHVARCLRGYLSSFHVGNPEHGLRAARTGPRDRPRRPRGAPRGGGQPQAHAEELERPHRRLRRRLGADRAVRRRVVLARAVESDKTRKEISGRKPPLHRQGHALEHPCATSPGHKKA